MEKGRVEANVSILDWSSVEILVLEVVGCGGMVVESWGGKSWSAKVRRVVVFAVDENAGVSRRYLCTCFQYIV